MKRAPSSFASELNVRAADAVDRTRKMPPGHERAEALQKATILEDAGIAPARTALRGMMKDEDIGV